MKPLYYIAIVTLFACSKSEDGPSISQILIEVSTDNVLLGGEDIIITANAINSDFDPIQGLNFEYYANDMQLPGNVFHPSAPGEYHLQVKFNSVSSKAITVRVVSLDDNIDKIEIVYDGYEYLTTNAWSVTGTFRFHLTIAGHSYTLDDPRIQLFLNDVATNERSHFYFPDAGNEVFHAEINGTKSKALTISVREAKTYDIKVLPIVFHVYGINITQSDVNKIIDTLNNSFSASAYSIERVKSGRVNPNAVNFYLKFEKATVIPPGKKLTSPGLNVINSSDDLPALKYDDFRKLEEEHMWDPDQYINIWLSPYFDISEENIPDDNFPNTVRGYTNTPILQTGTLSGLPSGDGKTSAVDPDDFSQSILLNTNSLLSVHIDYAVNSMGFFLGLFNIFTNGCDNDGDYVKDTHTWDGTIPPIGDNIHTSCTGDLFFPNNHMSFNRRYSSLTYDQRERVRFTLEHAFYRP